MARRLPLLCPQEYVGVATMRVVPCTRCSSGWSVERRRCDLETGCENMSLEEHVPECPIQDRCQHQVQLGEEPCPVRARGMICESALDFAGVEGAAEHPLAFNAQML